MAGRNINMQISPLPERQRHRKFRTHLKGVTDHADILHQEGHDPRENRHDEDDHHHHDDDTHHDTGHATEAPPAPVPEAVKTSNTDIVDSTPSAPTE